MSRCPWIVVLSMVFALGCEKKEEATPEPTPESPTETKPEAATPPPKEEAKRGLADPSNDPAFVKEVEAVLACEWKNGRTPTSCEAYKAFFKDARKRMAPYEMTLVNMLHDENPYVRILGSKGLSRSGEKFRIDKETAAIVLDAVESEKDERLDYEMGHLAGRIKPRAQVDERILKVISSHPMAKTRNAAISGHFKYPLTPEQTTTLKERFTAEDDGEVKRTILSSIRFGSKKEQKTEVCEYLWGIANGDSKDEKLTAHAAYEMARWSREGACLKENELLLQKLEKLAKDGAIEEVKMAWLLKTMIRSKTMPKDTLKRVRKIAEEMLKNTKHKGMVRSEALRTLASTEGGAMKLAKKYKDDKEFFVRTAAKNVIDGKIKPKPIKK